MISGYLSDLNGPEEDGVAWEFHGSACVDCKFDHMGSSEMALYLMELLFSVSCRDFSPRDDAQNSITKLKA